MSDGEPRFSEFPLFPLEIVALPSEVIPLHIFEPRYKTMIAECLERDSEFGIIWLSDDGLRDVGCACRVDRVLERLEDGSLNIVARGTRPLRVTERQSHLPYPAGVVEFLPDVEEAVDLTLSLETRSTYGRLVKYAADRDVEPTDLAAMGAYAMTASVDFGPEVKQGLLELRSENARLALALRLFRAAVKRLDFIDRAQARALSNGKVRFG